MVMTEIFHRAHSGTSMNPTLNSLDLLEITPAAATPVRPGDVVLFRPPGWTEDVVHRITRIREDWIRTRGDNSKEEDPWLLQHEEIQGIVTAAWRADKRRTITGARRGLLYAKLIRLTKQINTLISAPLRPIYRLISKLDLSILLPPTLQPRVLTCSSGDVTSRRMIMGKRVVGQYNEETAEWAIRRPYRLFTSTPSPSRGRGTNTPSPPRGEVRVRGSMSPCP